MTFDFGPLPLPTVTRVAQEGVYAGKEEVTIEWGSTVIPADRSPAAVEQAMRTVDEALPMLRPAQRRAVMFLLQRIFTRGDAFNYDHDNAHGTAFDKVVVSANRTVEDGLLSKAGEAPRTVGVHGEGICRAKNAGSYWHGEHADLYVGRRGGLTAYRHRKAKRGDGYVTDRHRGTSALIHGFRMNGL